MAGHQSRQLAGMPKHSNGLCVLGVDKSGEVDRIAPKLLDVNGCEEDE
jgi:hypothetical protein